jgi:hypothetical protein
MTQGRYRDVVTSHLREEPRIRASVLSRRRVFRHAFYDVYFCVYSGLLRSVSHSADLVTCMVVYRREALRVMFKLWAEDAKGDRSDFPATAIDRLRAQGQGPMQLVRDAKYWCGLPFTSDDTAALRMAGIEVPIRPTFF